MPLPKTTNVGTIMKELNRSRTRRPLKQKRAIALRQAGKSGASGTSMRNEIMRRARGR